MLSSAVLLDAGIKLATLQADAATTELIAVKRRRDGTMVAMLSRADAETSLRWPET